MGSGEPPPGQLPADEPAHKAKLWCSNDFVEVPESDGWKHVGAKRWAKDVPGALGTQVSPIGTVSRRVTRDTRTDHSVEDFWVNASTSRRRTLSSFRVPRDCRFEVDLDEAEDVERVNPEDVPLPASEATLFRGTSARVNCMAVGRPDLQFCSKVISRRMATPCMGRLGSTEEIGSIPY